MNYPLWALPASGLLIAFVAIVHVFISHFAVGGGLFLVLAERKARREQDSVLLDFVRAHTRFFALLTLVMGALTGVGIWFTIGLVHPGATSSLINTFVWGWAIEWTFFVVEIAAAMVYFYGWDRLDARTHMTVGWIYFWSAWLSLVVINGILTFMLTPGAWLTTRRFWDGILNPTYLPGVVARTAAAMALAGVYALWTASRSADGALKEKIADYAIVKWITPMAVVLPVSLVWLLAAAAGAGVPVGETFGASGGSWGAALRTILRGSTTGQPIAQIAAQVLMAACIAALVLCGIVLARRRQYGRPITAALMLCSLAALGAAEWVREDLRKPYVIGNYMFVNGVRLPSEGAGARPPDGVEPDRYGVEALNRTGVLAAALWTRLPAGVLGQSGDARALAEGAEIFRLQCSACHTIDGYMAIRPLVRKASPTTLDATIRRLAATEGAVAWSTPGVALRTWRNRRMPPFVGTREERRELAVYLARLGGAEGATIEAFDAEHAGGARFFEDNCSMCHGQDGDFPFDAKERSPDTLYEMIGRLPAINDAMPPLEATDVERRALAEYLATLTGKNNEAVR